MKYLYLLAIIFICNPAYTQISWSTTMPVADTTFNNMHPRIATDRSGDPLICWGHDHHQSVYFSRWRGSGFSAPLKLNLNIPMISYHWMGPDIAAHGDTIYVVMKQAPEKDTSSHIYLVKSFDGGSSFSKPSIIDRIGDSTSSFPTITCDDNGNPIVAFMKYNNKMLESRWVVMRSTDCGNTFSTDIKASGWNNSAEVCDCCPGAVISSANNTIMLYRDNDSNIRDCKATVSSDGGASFTSGIHVDMNKWQVNSCPASGPDGVMIGDTLYSTFMSAGTGAFRNFLSKASLSNDTAATNIINLGQNISGLTAQNYPRIAHDGNALAVVWRQTVNNKAQLPLFFTSDVITKGLPQSTVLVDVDDIVNADVAIANGLIYVVWQDNNSGTINFRTGNYINAGMAQIESNQSAFSIYPNPVTDLLNLTTDNQLMRGEARVTDILGNTIYNTQSLNTVFDFTGLSSGIYFVQIRTEDQILIKKIVKE